MNTHTGILELPSGGGDGRIRKFNNGLEETPDDPYLPSELAQKFGVTVTAELGHELPQLSVDEVKMRQVVVNLLVNAVKFSPRDSAVTVRTVQDGACVRCEVHDKGPGIDPDTATHVMIEAMKLAHSSSRSCRNNCAICF